MHSLWSGSISFGLVNIPIKLYSGAKSHSLEFNMLRKSDLCPVEYLRICKNDGKEIPYEDIVKGYEYSDGEYVVLTDEDFISANVAQTRTIEIMDFVDEGEIDMRYFEKPYYLEPDKGGDKAYVLLREALKKSGKIGVASFVIGHRGHIGVVKPHGQALVLEQIRFADEVMDLSELKLPGVKNIRSEEIELALTLVAKRSEKFNPKKYKDSYTKDLKRIIEEKSKGRRPKAKGKEPKPTKIIDLMTVLKKSLKEQEEKKHLRKRA